MSDPSESLRPEATQKARIWDFPTRLFHSLLIVLVLFSWWTGQEMHSFSFGGNQYFVWHIWSGCALLALILFRILWGFFGSDSARFSHFVKGPVTVLRYVRSLFSKDQKHWIGHNPLGGWAVMIMLLMLLVMPILGLMSYEDTFFLEGPLVHLVGEDQAKTFGSWHARLWDILLIIVCVHVVASLLYLLVKNLNLIGPIFTGRASLTPEESKEAETLRFRPLWLALICLLVTSGLVALAVTQL